MGALERCCPPDAPVFQDETDARQHGDARRVKSDPGFIRLREEVLALIHAREAADA